MRDDEVREFHARLMTAAEFEARKLSQGHPFVPVPHREECSQCGRSRADRIHSWKGR